MIFALSAFFLLVGRVGEGYHMRVLGYPLFHFDGEPERVDTEGDDGSQHYTEEGKERDEFRTEILEGYDLKVIRFTNRQIDNNFRGVCEYIDIVIKASLSERADEK